MKIDNVSHLSTPARIDQDKPAGKVGDVPAQGPAGTGSGAHVPSADTADAGQDIDQARVAQLRQAISEGRLKIDTGRIADALIASVRDLLGG